MKKIAIGCDIGGSHISCAGINLDNGSILRDSYSSQKVDNKGSAGEILGSWIYALKDSISKIDKSQLAGIGFAMPGPFEYDKGIAKFTSANDKYENLYGIDVGAYLKEKLDLGSSQEVRFINDATAFAVGEAWAGKASLATRSLSVTLGTGFGSAFIDNGIPVVEREDVPQLGCVWHLPFKDSIADDYFSTRWFIKRFAEKSGWHMVGVKEIAQRVASDARAFEVFTEFGQNLGTFLGPWLAKFKADTLVMGGNISAAYHLFGPVFEKSLIEQGLYTFCFISELKEDAALIGSARLFDENSWIQMLPLLPKM
jgi:glucokinase